MASALLRNAFRMAALDSSISGFRMSSTTFGLALKKLAADVAAGHKDMYCYFILKQKMMHSDVSSQLFCKKLYLELRLVSTKLHLV